MEFGKETIEKIESLVKNSLTVKVGERYGLYPVRRTRLSNFT